MARKRFQNHRPHTWAFRAECSPPKPLRLPEVVPQGTPEALLPYPEMPVQHQRKLRVTALRLAAGYAGGLPRRAGGAARAVGMAWPLFFLSAQNGVCNAPPFHISYGYQRGCRQTLVYGHQGEVQQEAEALYCL